MCGIDEIASGVSVVRGGNVSGTIEIIPGIQWNSVSIIRISARALKRRSIRVDDDVLDAPQPAVVSVGIGAGGEDHMPDRAGAGDHRCMQRGEAGVIYCR